MGNGDDLGVGEVWSNYNAEHDKDLVEYRAKQMSTNIIMAKALGPAIKETRTNTRFRWLFLGGALVIVGVLIPIVIKVLF